MQWLITSGTAPARVSTPSYTTFVSDKHPAEWFADAVAEQQDVIDKGGKPMLVWLAFAVPVESEIKVGLNVIAEVARETGRQCSGDPTRTRWVNKFSRLLQDTIGKVRIEVAP